MFKASRIDFTDATLASSLAPVQCASLAPPASTFEQTASSPTQKDPYGSKGHTHTHTRPPLGEAKRAKAGTVVRVRAPSAQGQTMKAHLIVKTWAT